MPTVTPNPDLLSPEALYALRLLQECLTGRLADSETVPAPHDWQRWLRIARWHRLVPALFPHILNHHRLNVPEPIQEQLRADHQQNTIKALRLTRDLITLVKQFRAQEIDTLSVKGPVLSQLLFKSPAGRHAGDLDLLIRPTRLRAARQLLLKLGYRMAATGTRTPVDPGLSRRQQRYVFQHDHHLNFVHPTSRTHIELHWALNANAAVWQLDFETLWQRRQTRSLGQTPVDTLSNQDTLSYLLLHGAKHAWFRLFWLYDVAHLLQLSSPEERSGAEKLATQTQTQRCLQAGCFLAEQLLGDSPNRRPPNRDLPECLITYPLSLVDSHQTPNQHGFWARVRHWHYRFSLLETREARRSEFERLGVSAEDFERFPLPDHLFPLYYCLRPFSYLLKPRSQPRG